MPTDTNSGLRTIGIILSTAGLIGVIIWNQSQSQKTTTDHLENEISAIRAAIALDDEREALDQNSFSAIRVQFEEVETQIDWLRSDIRKVEAEISRLRGWYEIHNRQDGEMWARLNTLEERMP